MIAYTAKFVQGLRMKLCIKFSSLWCLHILKFIQDIYFTLYFFKKMSTYFIIYMTLLIIPSGICKIEHLQEKINLINVQIHHSTFLILSMHANLGTRFKLKLINGYISVLFYYLRWCYIFNNLSKVNLVKLQKVHARLLSRVDDKLLHLC